MKGWRTVRQGLLLLLAWFIACGRRGSLAYEVGKCYCFDDLMLSERDSVKTWEPEKPEEFSYTYNGGMFKGGNSFDPCLCLDVTRVVGVLNVTESSYVTMAGDNTKIRELNDNVTEALLKAAKANLDPMEALHDRVVWSWGKFDPSSSDNFGAVFNIEVLLRGRNASFMSYVEDGLKGGAMQGGLLEGVGTVDTSTLTFTVKACSQGPLPALTNGLVTSSTPDWLAGESVTYTCKDNYLLSNEGDRIVSTCDHQSLTWSPLPSKISCIEDTRCMSSPPEKPQNTKYDWTGSRNAGTVITYSCKISYVSDEEESTKSTCSSKSWTPISQTFKCTYIGCSEPPPPLVDHGEINWDNTMLNGSQASYSCKQGFSSSLNTEPKVQCNNKTWDSLPSGFQCLDMGMVYDDSFEESQYFVTVTIPAIAGLSLAILLCLCCTRTDSPVFRICSGRRKDPSFA